jgi:hypothetical protein
MEIEYEPAFLEEAVLRAAAARPEGRLFYRERERVYHVADPEERGRAFEALAASWYERLGLGAPLTAALAAYPTIVAAVARCAVGRPPHRREIGADLLVRASGADGPPARLLRLLLPPALLLTPPALEPWLRRELCHVADMLDPRFGYEPQLPARWRGSASASLVRERYRVAWDATVDGRLVRAGRLLPDALAARRAEFLRTFGALGDAAGAAFERLTADPAPTHAALLELATAARGGVGTTGACPLCACPSGGPLADASAFPAAVLAEIATDFPAWRPADGCCRQCGDLYHARPLSREAEAALPGTRRTPPLPAPPHP